MSFRSRAARELRSIAVLVTTVSSIALAALGCRAPAAAAAEQPAAPAPEPAADHDAGAPKAAAAHGGHHGGASGHAKKFTVPFAAESDKDDPLAQTRAYFQALLSDNGTYMRTHDAGFFKAFYASQKPRATVVTCSDSRVQSPAFDATPENDDFFIRNIGNQVPNSEGSVEYGVHHLKTPVLFVLGHTGCGAVKAAMGDYAGESEPIRHELDGIKLKKRKEGTSPDDPAVWLDGVVENVHDQVAFALGKFDEEVAAGTLTIVGAVYDFRNDMKQGAGKVALVNVNGHKDAAKIQAFERGVLGLVGPDAKASDGGAHKDAIEIKDLKDLRDALREQHEPKESKEPKEKEPKAAAAKAAH